MRSCRQFVAESFSKFPSALNTFRMTQRKALPFWGLAWTEPWGVAAGKGDGGKRGNT
jgi:hypothetical protein